jgi:photosystem II stability/assembly factor-like uncharacterized protein
VLCALLALAAWVTPARGEQWRVQFFYDQNKSTLAIADLQFASATRGVAVGVIQEGRRRRPVSVVTSDGGTNWQLLELREVPLSLFFLNETLGWMVTEKGLWQTTEAGKSWRKVRGLPSGIVRVYFLNEQHGFAAGAKKTVVETQDGGKHWSRIEEAASPAGEEKYSAYTWIAFATPQIGLITGWNIPPRAVRRYGTAEFPDWMDPEGAVSRREGPHLSYSLQTRDGGKTWKASSASLFGDVTRVRFGPGGLGLGLIEHSNAFRYPSEALKIDWSTGKSETIYRDRQFAISDIWVGRDGKAWLAGTFEPGQIRNVVPGKVQVLRSRDKELTVWESLPVDYRAVANRVVLASVDDRNMWLATDNGMILKLVP